MSNPSTVGPYQLMQELGRGKRSVGYKAWQTNVGRPVALKTLRQHDLDAPKKFQAEARLSANLKTPGVRDNDKAGQTSDGCIFFVIEYAERSLKDLLRERFDRGQLFSRQEVGHLLMPIARAPNTRTPTVTVTPFRTPSKAIDPTSTRLRLTGTATALPTSLEQQNGAVVLGTAAQFTWDGDIDNSQATIIKLRHVESGTALESENLTITSWTTNLSLQDLSDPAQTHPLRPAQGRGFYGRTRTI